MGYCRVSLRDKEWSEAAFLAGEAWDLAVFHTLEALGWRSESPRTMATTLLRKSGGQFPLATRRNPQLNCELVCQFSRRLAQSAPERGSPGQ